jgi:hypothetical protein
MAKGWESKSVEDQVQQHEAKGTGKRRDPLTPVQQDRLRRREILLLSRARVEKDLESSQDQRYREQLKRALADLDSQIAALEEITDE